MSDGHIYFIYIGSFDLDIGVYYFSLCFIIRIFLYLYEIYQMFQKFLDLFKFEDNGNQSLHLFRQGLQV